MWYTYTSIRSPVDTCVCPLCIRFTQALSAHFKSGEMGARGVRSCRGAKFWARTVTSGLHARKSIHELSLASAPRRTPHTNSRTRTHTDTHRHTHMHNLFSASSYILRRRAEGSAIGIGIYRSSLIDCVAPGPPPPPPPVVREHYWSYQCWTLLALRGARRFSSVDTIFPTTTTTTNG